MSDSILRIERELTAPREVAMYEPFHLDGWKKAYKEAAIALGIFVRENKIEVIGLNYGAPKAQIPAAGKVLKNVKTLAGKKAEAEEIQMGNSGLLDIETSEMENDSFQDKAELVF